MHDRMIAPARAALLAATLLATPALAAEGAALPAPPANGIMGFVVSYFAPAIPQDKDACPEGVTPKNRDIFLQSLQPAERTRLLDKANAKELDKRWQASVLGPNGTNICSQPDLFDRPMYKTVKSKMAYGLNLDDDAKGAGGAETCAHENFTGPDGQKGIDNQSYRAAGCTTEYRGVDGTGGDIKSGTTQFMASGEWTQVILLRGVDSLVNDDDVEIVYGNTPDRPMTDSKGQFLPGASFTISDTAPRYRNVLHGRIVNGVLTTVSHDIKLAQTWGQGGARDIRGSRMVYDLRRARLQLAFKPDGTLDGLLGGYQPVFNLLNAETLGGVGTATVAGIDCAGQLKTLKALADGLRDPVTGKCTGISGALVVKAVPAFVNDVPNPATPATLTASAR